jgi:NAD(P)-dependent dehydrogenase (short-subunit alcohol dehydrogenase family)
MPNLAPITDRQKGKVAVVTGAASGIGAAIARRFVGEGGRVVGGDVNEPALEAMVDELGDGFVGMRCDVTVEDEVAALVGAAVDRFGALHAGFNVAGGSRAALIVDMTEEDWDFTVDLCLKGVFLSLKHEARRMIAQGQGGAIVNIASLNSRVPMFFGAAYSSAKAGVAMLGQSGALELAEHGIRVSTVSPGLTETPLVAAMTSLPRRAPRSWTASRSSARRHRRTSPPPRCSSSATMPSTSPVSTCSSTVAGSRPRTRTCAR